MYREGFPSSEIVVVDDVSTDNSVQVLKKLPVTLIEKKKNGGFASSVNAGMKYFLEVGADYLLVSNSDIVIDPKTAAEVASMTNRLGSRPGLGVVGFVEQGIEEEHMREGADIGGFLFMVKKRLVEEVGKLDESFFMYGEEQDYFRRVLKQGYEIEQSGIVVEHLNEKSSTSKLRNSWLAIRNSVYLEAKTFNLFKILRKIAVIFLLINRLYQPPRKDDPSVERVKRPGLLLGNVFLIAGIFWSFSQAVMNIGDRSEF